MSWHPRLSDDAILPLVDHLTTLHTLNLNGCAMITALAVETLANDRRPNFPYIEAKVTPGTRGTSRHHTRVPVP